MHTFVAIILRVLPLILLVVCSKGKHTCPSQTWFGPSCEYKCRCDGDASHCDRGSGQCVTTCLPGWFGPACQYRIANSSLPAWATDGDPQTCNAKAGQPIKARLVPAQPLSWLLLAGSSPENLERIEVQYVKKDSTSRIVCPRMNGTSTTSSLSREVFCPVADLVSEIILTGKGLNSLCSVEISLGRNVALKQDIYSTQPAVEADSHSASSDDLWPGRFAVDGEIWSDSSSCSDVSTLPDGTTLSLVMDHVKEISAVYLYFKMTSGNSDCCEYIENYFSVTLLDDKFRKLESTVTEKQKYSMAYVVIISLSQLSLVSMVTVESLPRSGELSLCEIEAYGDCPSGRYGTNCEWDCNCQDEQGCSPTGRCIGQCPPGFSGSSCNKACHGKMYGPDCKLPCSPFCRGDRCDPRDGTCTMGCEHKFQPPKCLKPIADEGGGEAGSRDRSEGDLEWLQGSLMASMACVVLIALSVSCFMYAHPSEEAQTRGKPSRTLDMAFLTYDDVKPPKMSRRPSWGSNICDDGGEDVSLSAPPSQVVEMDWDDQTAAEYQNKEETTRV